MASVSETDRLRRYARLVVGAGVDLRPGQRLLIHAEIAHAELVRAIAEDAYANGASYVDVLYTDPWVHRAMAEHAPEETLSATPRWQSERLTDAISDAVATVRIVGAANAAVFKGVDSDRLAKAEMKALRRQYLEALRYSELSWTIVACPDAEWATEALGEPDVERLWEALEIVLRLDAEDPAAAWHARADELAERCGLLNERNFNALRYRGPGTDLEIGLIPGAKFLGGREETRHGQRHIANIPTEEVFTSPDRNRAEGTVRSTKPLALSGGVVEGLEVTFERGRITKVEAEAGAELVRAQLETDDAAAHLGEVALVDNSSRVAEAGLVFFNTLFDENAVSHIAYGAGFVWAVEHLEEGDPGHQMVNQSGVHTDFMVGGPEVEIDGVSADGEAVPLLYGGEWQI